jgi:nucleotide-binding universal stress UspA family protein
MQRILVAIDGLPGSEKALELAVQQALQTGAQLTALAVLESPADPQLRQIAEGAKRRARYHLQMILEAAVNFAHSRGVQLTAALSEGHPAETIVNRAEKERADLVVLGSRNASDANAGLGGTADQVSSHVPCTVMIVR